MQNNFKKNLLNLIMAGLCVFTILSSVKPVEADAAPPEMAPGSDLEAGQTTKVRMAEEVIIFDLTKLNNLENPVVPVSATFTMFNDGKDDEEMMARFPIGCIGGDDTEITKFEARANNNVLPVVYSQGKPILIPLPPLYNENRSCETMDWAEFPVKFSSQKNTTLKITYELNVINISASGAFGYILETGSGWYGKIGKGTLIVQLPYKATEENISCKWDSTTPLNPEYIGNEVKWKFKELEPTSKNNLIFTAVYPEEWQKVIDASEIIKQSPKGPDGYIQLGDAYFSVSFDFHGWINDHYAEKSIAAYKKASSIDPYLADPHSKIAYVLWSQQWHRLLGDDPEGHFLAPILKEISIALALDPENGWAKMAWGEINSSGKYILPTVYPAELPKYTATPTQALSETLEP